ncbi:MULTISPECIES: tetratricopeptide repeat protein [unclassified Corynebacterium]|uniref:tetratricopeptide repeat protein n=1 Tax=unclassified Corynebacterium TaxID=2624378 RepID=UPI001EF65EE2|nr:tetratricopeptide repeat protein [Corynebacterium sp. ACRQK]MCG7262572.1 tetratricopeptide repeat protein [Corynebacterium sp. ACRQL]
MTNPSNTPPSRFVAGAVDLGAVKQQAEQRAQAQARAAQAGAAAGGAGAAGAPAGQPGSAGGVGAGGAGAPAAFVSTITPENFELDLVVRSTQVPVVTLLGSARSEASEQMRKDFTKLAESQQAPTKWLFRYVDVDATPEVAQAFGVQAIPTVIALAAGRPLTNFEGGQPAAQLQGWVDAVVQAVDGKLRGLAPEEDPANAAGGGAGADSDGADANQDAGDPRLAAAAEKLEAEDYAGAIAEYDAILANSAQADEEVVGEARAARANALLMQRLSTGGDEFAESDRLLLAGDKPQAFDLLIEELRPSAEGSADHKKQAKARLLELFSLFDPADPEVIAGRTRMASALF